MVEDPYKVLGVSADATKDEIKKAYRKKAKEYHPDLHPDDPVAAQKMNEVNEAYDMLNNPQKYQNTQQSRSSTYQGSTYGNPYGNPYGNTGNTQGNSQGQGQWTYEEFNFEDLFGFGRRTYETASPRRQSGDSQYVCQAVDFINMGQYAYADKTLNSIVSGERNARWHYLSALANQGLGNTLLASERLDKAIQMEPGNIEYQNARQNLHSTGQSYSAAGQDYQNYAESMNRFCMSMCAMHFFCMFCCR